MADAGANSKLWTVLSLGAALSAATMAKKGLNTGWKAATGKNPPENPADPDVEIWEAVTWAVVSGVAVGVARMLAQRRAASYYVRSTGRLPGQLARDGK